ncbi:C-X-C motif chemokine 11-1-like [Acipenser oxyrinchus oxyrinchus]|uniref:C-X-C motif chemokine n=1 Tax=Acipenser oxyrinchus oxyrinchus TaxID=40147 RepID=A0AAD8CE28_ACIOX|nr:C-X-C motif chemokine 11-1-like [Acipenser oxyrinchus oxyrinchus]KAK1176455.1 C-X-C motif chemokine 11-1-like [Acipenser oxyrinchus oxyrinchus]
MNSTAILCLAVLFCAAIEGSPMPGRGRCLCLGDGVNFIQPRLIEKLDVIPASTTCGNLEIIITLKNSGELRCLNPKSKFARNFIKNERKSIEGSPMPGKGRCHCLGDGVNFIQPRLIEKLDVIPASMTCGNLEIIITLKNSGELRCLNPKSKFAQNFIKNAKKMSQQ